jgi:hypothetical protein
LIILLISLGLHVFAGILFGSFVIYQHFAKSEVLFEAAPEVVQSLDPQKIVHEVSVKKRMTESGRPPVLDRIQSQSTSAFALPEIDVTSLRPARMEDSVMLQSFPLAGSGIGVGSGSGAGGGAGLTGGINFFGIQTKAERIVILVDTSVSMIEDLRGGVTGYRVLKDELRSILDALPNGSLFNLMTFDDRVEYFSSELMLVNSETRQRAERFLAPYLVLSDPNDPKTLVRRNSQGSKFLPVDGEFPNRTGSTRTDLAVAAALKQLPDAIFIISDGNPLIWRTELTPDEQKAMNLKKKEVEAELARNARQWERVRAEHAEKIRREDEARRSRGLPPKFVEMGRGVGPGVSYPILDMPTIVKDVTDYADKIYTAKGLPLPRIYTVGYACDPGEEAFMRELARRFQGRYRAIRGLSRPIKDNQ